MHNSAVTAGVLVRPEINGLDVEGFFYPFSAIQLKINGQMNA
tara:strand:- start:5090 stop:5215 length:126 start_codon:yes stop_codon:yes gene_type:complete